MSPHLTDRPSSPPPTVPPPPPSPPPPPVSHAAAGPVGPGTPTGPRSIPLLIAAGVLVITVVTAVLLFGVQRPPTLDTVAATPDPVPPAAVAWSDWQGERGQCITIAYPDGRVEDAACVRQDGEVVGFVDEGIVFLVWGERSEYLVLIDPLTGEELEQRPVRPGTHPLDAIEDGWDPGLQTRTRDGEFQLVVDGEVIWAVDAPEGYDLTALRRSPDGSMLVAVDRAGRVLVVPVDGSAPPRVWGSGVNRWRSPMWQGTDRKSVV